MNPNILIVFPALIAIAMLVVLYLVTFGLKRRAPATLAIHGKVDATGRTLRQRLDQSEASFR